MLRLMLLTSLFGLSKVLAHDLTGPNDPCELAESIDAAESAEFSRLSIRGSGRCGVGFDRVCLADECCSSAGAYCRAPLCQLEYGPACDGNIRPDGPDTQGISRRHVGSVPYGKGIYDCTVNGVVALTFDDGPWEYTEYLLDLLKKYDVKATFFVVGRNMYKGAMNNESTPWPNLIRRMINEGHQIGSHTWTHQKLPELSEEQFHRQMYYNEIALTDLLGYFPTYMRPPHSMSTDVTDGWLSDLGYHIAYFDLNTRGYENDSPDLIQNSRDIWDARISKVNPSTDSILMIEHDPLQYSVHNLIEYVIQSFLAKGFRGVTLGDCLNDPSDGWYRAI